MKVGVDVRLLSCPLTGIGRYTYEMCSALSKLPNVTLYLYSPAPLGSYISLDLETINIRTKNWRNGLLKQIWTETYLPLWAKKDNVDVFWGTGHRLPRYLPKDIPRVVTIHDLVWKYAADTMRPLSLLLEKNQMPFAVRSADHIVADTQATASAILNEFTVDMDKLSVITPGVNKVLDSPKKDALKSLGIIQPYFLFVGTLEPRKNLINLFSAYARLPEAIKKQAKLVVAGGKGWGGVDLQSMVARLNLDKYVRLLGYVDELTLAALYANAQFLAMPSLYEGFGFPLVEAMAYGTPVLAANNSSMPEVTGNAGLLVDAHDIESISNGLELLISDDEIRRGFSSKSKANALRFNWDTSAQKLLTVFETAISIRNG